MYVNSKQDCIIAILPPYKPSGIMNARSTVCVDRVVGRLLEIKLALTVRVSRGRFT